ncbi:MAG: helix-turn-helix domain-containing protein, partial [Acidimicrobiia bacterium]
LSGEDRRRLESLARKQTAERRMVVRARIVLAAVDGEENVGIADRLGIAPNTVIKWRKRFFLEGMCGLADRKRSGRPRGFFPLWWWPRSNSWPVSCLPPPGCRCRGGAIRSWPGSW